MNETNLKHFKAAQISGMEVSLKDLEKINGYALSKLDPADIFAFKVCMAGNEIDRDFEVFPRSTLVKLANLFVGKTVVKDHEHKSDNQIARIYSTELVENDLARMTKTGEVFTQLIAKCYMVKTSKNADLIAEIQAGIRKEVSLGCRVDKAVCSICGTDNVKTYCEHFPGKRYNSNQLCYFSLENASDAYELSFVAVPAQAHAGTVKAYGDKPFRKSDLEARERTKELEEKGEAAAVAGSRMVAKQVAAEDAPPGERAAQAPEVQHGEGVGQQHGESGDSQEPSTKEMLKQLHDIAQQLLVLQKDFIAQKEAEQAAQTPEEERPPAQTNVELQAGSSEKEAGEQADSATDKGEPADEPVDSESELSGSTVNPDEKDEAKAKEAEEAKGASLQKDEPSDKEEPAQAEQEQAALKDKAAQARLRALDLALSLRKRS